MNSLLFVFLFVFSVFALKPTPKNLAGLPSEFNIHAIPPTTDAAETERSAVLWVDLQNCEAQKVCATIDLPVDSTSHFMFSMSSKHAEYLTLSLSSPSGKNVALSPIKGEFPLLSSDNSVSIPESSYVFTENIEIGVYTLTIKSDTLPEDVYQDIINNVKNDASVILFNDSPLKVWTHVNTFDLHLGNEIGLVARITDAADTKSSIPAAKPGVVVTAEMEVILPDGQQVEVDMKDDGLNFDGAANDGVYGAVLKATEVGTYLASAVITGEVNGVKFIRTTSHVVPVVKDEMSMKSTTAKTSPESNDRVTMYINVEADSTTKYRTFAEVWGTSETGLPVSICWVGGMTHVTTVDNEFVLPVELDLKWIAKAQAYAPFSLKNVYVADADNSIPLSKMADIPVSLHSSGFHKLKHFMMNKHLVPDTPTYEMRNGEKPDYLKNIKPEELGAGAGTLLSHGYCAGSNPFDKYTGWKNPIYFLQPSANILNDEFANNLFAFANSRGYSAYAGIGHSQGGMALTHLKNYYHSGLDAVSGGRVIQSVGTPYQGCSAAGSAGDMGKAFGIGCGANSDLAVEGAKLWLTGITSETRSQVNYYTTTYELGKLFGDWCNMAINMILEWPNDGTTELEYASLPGGASQGNTEKWCHTTGMGYEAQYYDNSRNAEMASSVAS